MNGSQAMVAEVEEIVDLVVGGQDLLGVTR
jgi:hypothetical protein